MARACTLLTVLNLIYDSGCAPHFAPLLASATVVSARVEVHADVVSVAIANANFSAWGSIKLAHDVITWAKKLKIADQGVVAETVITMYNAQASQATAVKGARKTSLTNLLRPECRSALKILVELVGLVGPSQVFWEEHCWANKRILPRYRNQHSGGAKVWQDICACYSKVVHAVCSIS